MLFIPLYGDPSKIKILVYLQSITDSVNAHKVTMYRIVTKKVPNKKESPLKGLMIRMVKNQVMGIWQKGKQTLQNKS